MLIGLSGKALSGKDTIADYLMNLGLFDSKLSFAGNLKECCINVFNLTKEHVNTQQGKSSKFEEPVFFNAEHLKSIVEWMQRTHYISLEYAQQFISEGICFEKPRDILQFVGTDVMRFLCPTYHTDVLEAALSEGNNSIITDIRFMNEISIVKKFSGFLVRVVRPENLRLSDKVSLNNHSSENSLDNIDSNNWDFILNNYSSSLELLYKDIDKMFVHLEKIYGNRTQTSKKVSIA